MLVTRLVTDKSPLASKILKSSKIFKLLGIEIHADKQVHGYSGGTKVVFFVSTYFTQIFSENFLLGLLSLGSHHCSCSMSHHAVLILVHVENYGMLFQMLKKSVLQCY